MIGIHTLILIIHFLTGFRMVWKVVRIIRRVKAVRNEKTPSNDVRAARWERAAAMGEANIDRKSMNKMKQVSQSML
jgi:hypothetical protein